MNQVLSLAARCLVPATLVMAASAAPAVAGDKKGEASELVPTGEPVSCIMPHNIRSTRIIDDQTIDFTMTNGTIYRNTLPYRCPSLAIEERFSYKLSTSQLCSVDIITVLHNFGGGLSQGPSCGLGMFQKMEKPAK